MTDRFDLYLERILDAPRGLVWQAWTNPEHIKRWWAPRPYQTPECEIELRPGGKFHTRMTGPDGFDFSGTACILEAVAGERIIWSTTMKGGYRPNEFTTTAATAFLSPRSTRSRTRPTARPATQRPSCTRTPRTATRTRRWASMRVGAPAPSSWQKLRANCGQTPEQEMRRSISAPARSRFTDS